MSEPIREYHLNYFDGDLVVAYGVDTPAGYHRYDQIYKLQFHIDIRNAAFAPANGELNQDATH